LEVDNYLRVYGSVCTAIAAVAATTAVAGFAAATAAVSSSFCGY